MSAGRENKYTRSVTDTHILYNDLFNIYIYFMGGFHHLKWLLSCSHCYLFSYTKHIQMSLKALTLK